MDEQNYLVHEIGKTRHVLVRLKRSKDPQPNFNGTGLALMAILNEKETLKHFLCKRLPRIKEESEESVRKFLLESRRK